MSKKSIFKFLIILLFICSLATIVIGLLKLYNSNKDVSMGRSTAEHIVSNEINNNDGKIKIIEQKGNIPFTPIATLTFLDNDNFKIAILDGVSKEILKYGAGKTIGSAYPCENGNCVLLGHRDSAFKKIPNTKKGDRLLVTTTNNSKIYTVENMLITDEHDPKIFEKCEKSQLTLVTCYPFSFVGPSPKRCIIQAFCN